VTRADFEHVWRLEAPHVLGALVRRYSDFDRCEDALQEALIAASLEWPGAGVPDSPRGWLLRVASRRRIDALRSDQARIDRERRFVSLEPGTHAPAAELAARADHDDTVQLLVLCCDPTLTRASQVALTLRAVGGLTTAQIASAFLVPETTMAQRISRAKATLRATEVRFEEPSSDELPERLEAVLRVLYLIFNEGYATSRGGRLMDLSLTREAIRLTRELRAGQPGHDETAGLLALMLLTEARSAARTDERGDLVPLERQDRRRWDSALIGEGVEIIESVLARGDVGPFQLQAAIAAVHAEAATWPDTDWLEITMLYRMLDRLAPSPLVTLNLAVAAAMAHGPQAGLDLVEPLLEDETLFRHHRTHAVRAHLLEMADRPNDALAAYVTASRLTTSLPEQRYLNARAVGLRQRLGD
jgi:RNA polymerase sigma factor (sigma-70 family)